LTAGLTKLSVARFLLADGLYAIPGVSALFFLGWWFGDSMIDFVKGPIEQIKSILLILVIAAVIGYLLYRALRKPSVTGDPHEMPPLVEQVTHTLEHVTSKFMHPLGGGHSKEQPAPAPDKPAQHLDGDAISPATPIKDSKAAGPPG
jgi:hypothetical protein